MQHQRVKTESLNSKSGDSPLLNAPGRRKFLQLMRHFVWPRVLAGCRGAPSLQGWVCARTVRPGLGEMMTEWQARTWLRMFYSSGWMRISGMDSVNGGVGTGKFDRSRIMFQTITKTRQLARKVDLRMAGTEQRRDGGLKRLASSGSGEGATSQTANGAACHHNVINQRALVDW